MEKSDGNLQVPLSRVPGQDDLSLPAYMSPGSAGMDLVAAVSADLVVSPGERVLVGTGIRIALPRGVEGQVRPRSGMALHHGLTVLNSPGTIDSDYRGEIKVILVNLGQVSVTISRGDRIAQLVISPVLRVCWNEASDLPDSVRSSGGFGHTGRRGPVGREPGL